MKNRRTIIMGLAVTVVVVAVASLVLGGCGLRRARHVEHSGFLEGYYDLLKAGEKGEAVQVYRNPKADIASYNTIILDPIQVWRTKTSKEEDVPMEDLQRVANNFHLILTKALSKDYTVVADPTKAGNRAMRIQIALTSMVKGGGIMDNVTAIIPVGLGIAAATDFITGRPPFVGDVAVEAKFTDGRTGMLLAAGVDKRVGGKDIEKLVDSWADVNKIMELWAKILVFRLCEARGGKDCLPPAQ